MRLGLSVSAVGAGPLGSSAAFVGTLDAYTSGIAGAWSVARRLLSSYAGSLIRVRRSSDSTEQDIGYNSTTGLLDTVSLLAFVGAGDGYVTKIYDQSGLGRDFVQSTASAQCCVVASGSLLTLGGTPTMNTTSSAQGYATATFTAYTGVVISAFMRASIANNMVYNRMLGMALNDGTDYSPISNGMLFARNASTLALMSYRTAARASAAIAGYNTQFVSSAIYNGATCAVDTGTATNSGAFTYACNINQFYSGGYLGGGAFNSGIGDMWAEAVIYTTDKSSAKSAIRTALTP